MPTFRGVSVHVTDADGNILREYGTRSWGRAGTISSYIQSESEMQFKVSALPDFPFPISNETRAKEVASAYSRSIGERLEEDAPREDLHLSGGSQRRAGIREDDTHTRSYARGLWTNSGVQSRQDCPNIYQEWLDEGPSQGSASLLSDYLDYERSHNHAGRYDDYLSEDRVLERLASRGYNHPTVPKWHLLMSVYLDGRKKPERRGILYLDKNHPDFRHDGTVTLSHRWVQDGNGDIASHSWIFKEVGIETMLDKLLIAGDIAAEGKVCRQDEEDLLNALKAAGIDEKEETKQIGQLTVTLEKVRIGQLRDDWDFKTMHSSAERDDVEGGDSFNGLSHTAGLGRTTYSRDRTQPVRIVNYRELPGEKGPYATFKFYYRSEDVLRKFNFKDFPEQTEQSGSTSHSARQRINGKLSFLTPLSLSQASSSTTKQRPSISKGTPSTLGSASTTNKGSVKGIAIDTSKWKNSKFKYSVIRDKDRKDEDDDASDHGMDITASEAEQSEATLGVRLSPPSFRALSKAPVRDVSQQHPAQGKTSPTAEANRVNNKPQFRRFRIDDASTEEDADDEAESCLPGLAVSEHAPDSVIRARKMDNKNNSTDSEYDKESGVAQDEDDQGLGQRLAKVTLKRKMDVEELIENLSSAAIPGQGEMVDTSSMAEDGDNEEADTTGSNMQLKKQVRKRVKAGDADESVLRSKSISEHGTRSRVQFPGLTMLPHSDV